MNFITIKTILLFSFFSLFSVIVRTQSNEYPIIPVPAELVPQKGSFTLNDKTQLYFQNTMDSSFEEAFYLFREHLKRSTGFDLPKANTNSGQNIIICKLNTNLEKDEAYKLLVLRSKIEIEAKTPIGLFYALQSIRQLLPTEFEQTTLSTSTKWNIPCCVINDAPTFVYRGLHMDVSRHFVSVEEVKKYIDQIAMLKLNTFHWHLTDDQAWRIEIKKYPKLTTVGAYRNRTLQGHNNDYPRVWDNTRTGGFYTQEEIKDVVDYARKRFVTIIPEIEMPGHATAVVASYPELSCSGGPFDVEGRWGVFNDVFCTKDETFSFLEDVLTEVAALFPSPYIHIGGDECPKVRWKRCHACQQRMKDEGLKDEHQLQSYFVKRMETVVHKLGKRIIGWDEILEGGIAPDATVMSWRGIAGGISAAKQGHDVIMTPSEAMYFDFYQSSLHTEPLAIGGYLPIERVYAFNPYVKELEPKDLKHILGVQANTWTEYMPDAQHREMMVFPRVAALAEVGWTSEKNKDFDSFAIRLPKLMKRYDIMGINYSRAFYSVVGTAINEGGLKLKLSTIAPETSIHYTTDGSDPTLSSPIYREPIPVGEKEMVVKAISVKNNKVMYMPYERSFIANKAGGQKVVFENTDGVRFEQNGSGNLTDCTMGGRPVSRPDWFSYAGADGTITIEFEKLTSISKITFSSANQNNVLVYSPKSINFLVSEDGTTFFPVGAVWHQQMAAAKGKAIVSFTPKKVKKIKLEIAMYGIIPNTEPNSREMSALFVDEIIVE